MLIILTKEMITHSFRDNIEKDDESTFNSNINIKNFCDDESPVPGTGEFG